jgi:hypothetical protein
MDSLDTMIKTMDNNPIDISYINDLCKNAVVTTHYSSQSFLMSDKQLILQKHPEITKMTPSYRTMHYQQEALRFKLAISLIKSQHLDSTNFKSKNDKGEIL